ncbi:hypothetical protein SacmaDRAFT_4810 [Saccharomonospora marina XMU15]|uniref:LytR/CpsA/Psr regulator C-terminal domain-containing protein n=1 Tax=Saccharomonospora marina XMU15 TaxID=882083 RepID=H5WZ55_9PSEU|nr:LytR C-terminal domain-containing protein [Saccharomonospora marina]EHR52984.1 hypothetical protein SacmaDRAFT_4810 [Saccharomonospora marina XMU15]
MSIFDGLSRPVRAAGLGLLAVAVVAAVIGGVTLVVGDDDPGETAGEATSQAQPTPTGASPDSPSQSPAPSSEGESTGKPSAPATSSSPTAAPPGGGDKGGDDEASTRDIPVRVYNNSTVHGLASRAGDDLRSAGWKVVETGNYSGGIIPTTTVYYREGTDEKAAATVLASQFGIRAEPRFRGIADSSPGLIVIVTRDYDGAANVK